MRIAMLSISLLCTMVFCLTGCGQPDMDDMADMTPPDRPQELDRLDAFVGSWEGTSGMTCHMTDTKTSSTYATEAHWAANGWAVIEETTVDMPEGAKYHMVTTYTWDDDHGKYRMWGVDDWGMIYTGTATYDAKTKVWTMKGDGHNTMGGHASRGVGTVKMLDNDTMEWTHTEYDSLGWTKYFELSGTSKRK